MHSPSPDDAQEVSPLLSGHGPGTDDNGKPPVLGLEALHAVVPAADALVVQPREQPALQLGSLTPQQMLCTTNFWLLFGQFTIASGVCLAYLNNLGQLVVSLGGGHDGHVVFVSLFSVANAAGAVNEARQHADKLAGRVCGGGIDQRVPGCAEDRRPPAACSCAVCVVFSLLYPPCLCLSPHTGRLLMGYVPEQYLHERGTPRTVFLTITAVTTAVAAFASAYASLGHLYVISLLLGAAFGGHWSLLPAITRCVFACWRTNSQYTSTAHSLWPGLCPSCSAFDITASAVGHVGT